MGFFDFAGDLLGGIAGMEAADDISDAQRYATDKNTALARELYGDQRALNMPRVAAGNAALEQALGLTGLSFDRGADVTQAFGAPVSGGPAAGGGAAPGSNGPLYSAGGDLVTSDALRPEQIADLTRRGVTLYDAQGVPVRFGDAPIAPGSPGAPPGAQGAPGGASIEDVLKSTPGYEFRFNEGQRALDAAFSRGGGVNSGAKAKAAMQFGQNFATNEHNQQFNRLMQIIAPGSAAVANTQAAGTAYGNQVANANQNQANANAMGSAYKWNAIGNAGKGIADTLGNTDWSKVFGGGTA